MKIEMYSILDVVAGKFNHPFYTDNERTAIRAVRSSNDPNFKDNADDYQLYHVGTYDMEKGEVMPIVPAQLVIKIGSIMDKGEE